MPKILKRSSVEAPAKADARDAELTKAGQRWDALSHPDIDRQAGARDDCTNLLFIADPDGEDAVSSRLP